MGGVKYRYIKRESSGDQYVGVCVSGLEQIEKRLLLHLHTLISLWLRMKSKNPGKRKYLILSGCQDTTEG